MKDIKEITKCIARLWRLYKRQESLFRSAMKLDTSNKMRKVFSNGYMMTLLFRKDVDSMYESTKSILHDGDLSSIVRSMDEFDPEEANEMRVISELATQNQIMMEVYEQLLSGLDNGSEAALRCDEHIEKLSGLGNVLEKELEVYRYSDDQDYFSVA